MLAKKWDKTDFICSGHLSEFYKLNEDAEIRDDHTPTAIYPETKEWCIISEFDSPFTFVGGSKELIGKILQIDAIEIFELTPIAFT